MRAVRYSLYGGPEVLRLETDIPIPAPGLGEVLVKVHATSVNPADWKFRGGWFERFVSLAMPFIPGCDVAGTVVASGSGAPAFAEGETVFGMVMPQVGGASADYICLSAGSLARAPTTIPLATTAGVPLAALTAWFALFDGSGIERGQRLLVHGGAGGVASFAVQFARHAGAHVIATASSEKHELVRALGADEVIDYRKEDFSAAVRDVDVVLDTIGGEVQARSFGSLRRGGTLVTLDPMPPDAARCNEAGVKGIAVALEPDAGRLARIAALIDSGDVRVVVDSRFQLDQLAAAHARSGSGRASGKLIVMLE